MKEEYREELKEQVMEMRGNLDLPYGIGHHSTVPHNSRPLLPPPVPFLHLSLDMLVAYNTSKDSTRNIHSL
jgi:hypothetical protein